MAHEAFTDWKPRSDTNKHLLSRAIDVIGEYEDQGYELTLRQLYYQLVSRDIIPNTDTWYKRLGDVVSNGRMAGYIDWDSIVDRGRTPVIPADWSSPAALLKSAIRAYRRDRWEGQAYSVEVWCEKDALSSVIEPVADRYHVNFLALRGFSSSSAMYDGAKRFNKARDEGRQPVVIYLGDHDPSGIDMSRDIDDRLALMTRYDGIEVQRLALNWNQVEDYQPPPNQVKITDSRAADYIRRFGEDSWELDALEPQVLDALISGAIENYLDMDMYESVVAQENEEKKMIQELADRWEEERTTDD